MLWGVVELKPPCQASCLFGLECLVKRFRRVRIEIVQYDPDDVGSCVSFFHCLHEVRKIDHRTLIRYFEMALSR